MCRRRREYERLGIFCEAYPLSFDLTGLRNAESFHFHTVPRAREVGCNRSADGACKYVSISAGIGIGDVLFLLRDTEDQTNGNTSGEMKAQSDEFNGELFAATGAAVCVFACARELNI